MCIYTLKFEAKKPAIFAGLRPNPEDLEETLRSKRGLR